jgi:hypothetical protein
LLGKGVTLGIVAAMVLVVVHLCVPSVLTEPSALAATDDPQEYTYPFPVSWKRIGFVVSVTLLVAGTALFIFGG